MSTIYKKQRLQLLASGLDYRALVLELLGLPTDASSTEIEAAALDFAEKQDTERPAEETLRLESNANKMAYSLAVDPERTVRRQLGIAEATWEKHAER